MTPSQLGAEIIERRNRGTDERLVADSYSQ